MFKGTFTTDNGEQKITKDILGQTSPISNACKRKATDNSSNSSSSSEDKKPKAKKAKADNTQRKPKNFAERLMRVLQNGIGQDTLWWVGDGKAIGIHSRNLRRGDMLSEHFNVKDYSVFIRNCNRWGFRRTVQYKVPQGVITYECSLFQRDKPHLVHHMRMDSDVQDVFEKHKDLEGDAPFDPKRIAKAAKAAAAPSAKPPQTAVGPHTPVVEGTSAAMLNRVHPQLENSLLPGMGMGSLQGYMHDTTIMQAPGMPFWRADPPATVAAPAPLTQGGAVTTSESAILDRLVVGGASNAIPQQFRAPLVPGADPMLQRIMYLSQEYTDTDDTSTQTPNDPVHMAIRMLKLQGEKYEKEREMQRQLAARDPLSALRNQLLAATNSASNGSSNSSRPSNQTEQLLQNASISRLGLHQVFPMTGGLDPRNPLGAMAPGDLMNLLAGQRPAVPPPQPQPQPQRDSDSPTRRQGGYS